MLKNYLKTAWRTLIKNRVYSIINILGLTIGLCACMLVVTVVLDDLSYDKQWSRSKDLYRIVSVNKMGEGIEDRFASSLTGVGNALKNDFPEVQTVAELSIRDEEPFRLDQQDENGLKVTTLFADTSAWQMLDFEVLAGSPRHYVEGVYNLMITESFRKKHFPHEDPVGKKIYGIPLYNDQAREYLITGLIRDLPSNSVLRSELVVLKKPRTEEVTKQQYGTFSQNFILLRPNTNMNQFTSKVNHWYSNFVEVKDPYSFEFQPMKDLYLRSEFAETLSVKGDFKNIIILAGVSLLLLLIACVNFINLTTARAVYRMKETAVRKILGAGKRQLILQFLSESFLYFFIATVIGLLIYYFSLPGLESFLDHKLALTVFTSFSLTGKVLAAILVLSFLIGLYPALLLSNFKPAVAIKGNLFTGGTHSQNTIRKGLVVLQFSISIIVLIALIIVQQQVNFFNKQDIGFQKEGLLYTQYINMSGKGEALKNEMLQHPGVEKVSLTPGHPGARAI